VWPSPRVCGARALAQGIGDRTIDAVGPRFWRRREWRVCRAVRGRLNRSRELRHGRAAAGGWGVGSHSRLGVSANASPSRCARGGGRGQVLVETICITNSSFSNSVSQSTHASEPGHQTQFPIRHRGARLGPFHSFPGALRHHRSRGSLSGRRRCDHAAGAAFPLSLDPKCSATWTVFPRARPLESAQRAANALEAPPWRPSPEGLRCRHWGPGLLYKVGTEAARTLRVEDAAQHPRCGCRPRNTAPATTATILPLPRALTDPSPSSHATTSSPQASSARSSRTSAHPPQHKRHI